MLPHLRNISWCYWTWTMAREILGHSFMNRHTSWISNIEERMKDDKWPIVPTPEGRRTELVKEFRKMSRLRFEKAVSTNESDNSTFKAFFAISHSLLTYAFAPGVSYALGRLVSSQHNLREHLQLFVSNAHLKFLKHLTIFSLSALRTLTLELDGSFVGMILSKPCL